MPTREEMLAEAERRGLLSAEQTAALAEARKRGLIADQPKTDYFSGLTRELEAGATFGLGDYAGAAAGPVGNFFRSVLTDEEFAPIQAYKDRFAQIRGERGAFQDENPGAALAANIAGGMTIAPQVAGQVAKGVSAALPSVSKAVTVPAGLAAGGAAEGALVGGLEAEPGKNLQGAVTGGAAGAILAPSAYFIGLGAKKLLGPLASRLYARVTGGQPVRPEERKLLQAIEADQMTPARIEARLRTLGPQATIADAGGENVRGLTESLANQPGRTRNMAQRVLETRQGGQSARIAQAAQEQLGARGDFYGDLDALRARRARDAAPLYEEAFSIQPVTSERLREFVGDPIIKRGINRGLEIQRLEALADGRPFNPMDYAVTGFDEAGEAIIEKVPNLRLMDAAKRGLDETLDEARDGVTGKIKWTERLRAVDAVRRALVRELDDLTGGATGPYAQARAIYAGPSQSIDAMQQGRRFLRGDPEVTARIVEDMDEGSREFFREGVFQELQNKLGGTSETRDQTLKFLRTPNAREAIRAVMPDEDAYRKFMAQLMRERRFVDTKNLVRANSATARRLAGQEQLGVDPGVAVEAARGNYGGAIAGIIRKAVNSIREMPQAQKDRLGQMLLSQNRGEQQRALLALQNRYQRGQISETQWVAIRSLLAGEAGMLAGQSQGQ